MRRRVTAHRVAALERHRAARTACRHGIAWVFHDEAERAALAPCPRCGGPVGGVVIRVRVATPRRTESAASAGE